MEKTARVRIERFISGEVIDDIFYEQELTQVDKKNLEEEEFIVDKIMESKERDKNKQFLVSWCGYPSKFNSWNRLRI